MYLLMTEKASQARNFEKFLGGRTGSFEGKPYKIIHAHGHLLTFIEPKDAKDNYTKILLPEEAAIFDPWNSEKLPWPAAAFNWRLQPISEQDKKLLLSEVSEIQSLSPSSDVVVIAGDVDPSGEGFMIQANIIEKSGWQGKIMRLVHEETEKSVKKGFRQLIEVPNIKNYPEWLKADARRKFDYLSMQWTVAATSVIQSRKHQVLLNEGRLKSVETTLIWQQEEAIKNYVKKPFYEIRFEDDCGNHNYKQEEPRIFENRADAENMILEKLEFPVKAGKPVRKRTAPPKLFDLADLSAKLAPKGIKPRRLLEVYQKLYEAQIVSYPRTEDKKINQEMFEELLPVADQIAALLGVDSSLALLHKQARLTHISDKVVHGANRPGLNVPDSLESLKEYGEEAPQIYGMVARSFLAMICSDYVFDSYSASTGEDNSFTSVINFPVTYGWKDLFLGDRDFDDKDSSMVGGVGTVAMPYVYEGANKKPEQPSIKWLKNKLSQFNVGTGATRVQSISDITQHGSLAVEKKGKLSLTEKGRLSGQLLVNTQMASPKITERLVTLMDECAQGLHEPQEVAELAGQIVIHDLPIMQENAQGIPLGEADSYQPKEKVEGLTDKKGKAIKFNRVYRGHTFSDDETEMLSQGQEITFVVLKDGKEKEITGSLKWQTYKGHKFLGFMETWVKGYSNKKGV